jgi:hypothetical protein
MATPVQAQRPDVNAGGSYNFGYFDSYNVAVTDLAVAASATDIFCINGSATRTIYISNMYISGSATGNNKANIQFYKRSTADTGGSSTNPTIVPSDSRSPASSATVNAYTANPTTGTLIGLVRSEHAVFPNDGTPTATGSILNVNFGVNNSGKLMILRGAAEGLCINLNGETIAGGVVHITASWIEQQP